MSKPVVAIVGRPNVGKSTLFNALAGEMISIVKDTPGVTRDRIYAEVTWLDREFTLIDTGGIEPDSKDIILAQMREQAQIAIDTADVIIFITDVRQGLQDSDSKVADMLRRSGKPVVLVVNKVDSFQKLMADVYEFYNLGIGDPIPISASSRLGLGDMLDAVAAHFPEHSAEEEEDERPRIAIVGKPNVGKSSLLNALLEEDKAIVTDIAGTTRDIVEGRIHLSGLTLHLIDTAGIRETEDVVEQIGIQRSIKAIEEAQLVIVVLDGSREIDAEDEKLLALAKDKTHIVVYNKSDLKQHEGICISAAKGEIQPLLDKIHELYDHHQLVVEEPLLTNERQISQMLKAKQSMLQAIQAMNMQMALDLVAIDIQDAYTALKEILGEVHREDLLDALFSNFCLGK